MSLLAPFVIRHPSASGDDMRRLRELNDLDCRLYNEVARPSDPNVARQTDGVTSPFVWAPTGAAVESIHLVEDG